MVEVLRWQQDFKERALRAVMVSTEGGTLLARQMLPVSLAMVVRDASMASLAFGHSSYGQRSETIITAKASAHASSACSRPDCAFAGCRGNRFECMGGSSAWGADQWQLVVAHSKSGHGTVLRLNDPEEVQLLEIYERRGRPTLLVNGDQEQAMYVTANGLPYTQQSLSQWWRELHR